MTQLTAPVNITRNRHRTFYDLIKNAAAEKGSLETWLRRDKNGQIKGRTFTEMKSLIDRLIAGLIKEGVHPGDRITFLCDSSVNWILCDCAIISAGAVSVPRGTDVTDEDIEYIVNHSESRFALVQTAKDRDRLLAMQAKLPTVEKVFIIEDSDGEIQSGEHSLGSLIDNGAALLEADSTTIEKRLAETSPDELATLIYTSGTTGAPKGVMLNQSGWINMIYNALQMEIYQPGDTSLSLLPPWHAFERAVEYAALLLSGQFMVSNITNLRKDLAEFQPTSFPSVPRIWESLYQGIMQKIAKEPQWKQNLFNFFLEIGKMYSRQHAALHGYMNDIEPVSPLDDALRRVVAGIIMLVLYPLNYIGRNVIFKDIHKALGGKLTKSVSGGSALPRVVDDFLSGIGIKVIEGYGMTETSALISVRHLEHPTSGTVGKPIAGYQIRLKDEQGKVLENQPGTKGTLWVKSDQILKGYYKRDDLNKVVFDKDGFFDTGDLMVLNARGELMFAGRSKDTLALAGGENVEPVPVEDKLLASPLIDQVMVVGDDRKTLGALIVPAFETIETKHDVPADRSKWNTEPQVRALFSNEIARIVNTSNGFKSFEVIPKKCFTLLEKPFDLDTEMTRTLKMKRPVIKENYQKEIDAMYR